MNERQNPMTQDEQLLTLQQAYLQTHNAFQRLALILERKGLLTAEELAEVYEGPTEGVSNA